MEQKITMSEAVLKRKSVRDYDMTPLSSDEIGQILDYAGNIQPLFSDEKTSIRLIGPNDVRSIRSWRSPHYLAIYAGKGDKAMLNVGYVYEQLVVYLTSLGIGTCWANSVLPKVTKDENGLKWAATIAFGIEKNSSPWRENTNEAVRRTLASITDKTDEKLEVARFAPSSMNSQPWYFTHSGDKIRVYCVIQSVMKKWMSGMNKIDIGIAVAHLKVANPAFKFEVETAPAELTGYTYIGTVTL